MYKNDLIEKNVISVDNENYLEYIGKDIIKTIDISQVKIDYIDKEWNLRYSIKGKFYIKEISETFGGGFNIYNVNKLDKPSHLRDTLLIEQSILDHNILSCHIRKVSTVPYLYQKAHNYTTANHYISGNKFFYGKKVVSDCFVDNVFIWYSMNQEETISKKEKDFRKYSQYLIDTGIEDFFQEKKDEIRWYYEDMDCFQEDDIHFGNPIENYVQPFLGMDKFYYEDNANYDLIEKYDSDTYNDDDRGYYFEDDCYFEDEYYFE